MNPTIAILGAGPAGLTLARLLEVKKIDYILFDRDASPTAAGAGGSLDVHTGTGQLALEKAGLFDIFKSQARYEGQAMKAMDKSGGILWDKAAEGQTDRPEIDRKDLRRLLLDSVPSTKIQWGHQVESVSRDNNGSIAVRFANGRMEKGFGLVVGADGAWSRARKMITSSKPIYSGVTQLQTSISPQNSIYSKTCQQCGHGMTMALSDGRSITIQRLGDDSYNIYTGLKLPENWAETESDLFRSPDFREHIVSTQYADWSPEITQFVKHSDGDFHPWPLYALPVDSLGWQSVPGLTLLGDAAHLSLPNGEGVNCAMFDSLELAEAIEKCGVGNLDEAVRIYEENMFPRGVAHIKDGNELMGDTFHADDSPRGFKAWVAAMTGET